MSASKITDAEAGQSRGATAGRLSAAGFAGGTLPVAYTYHRGAIKYVVRLAPGWRTPNGGAA